MKLVTKVLDPLNNFWVEDYNEKAKEFYLRHGFEPSPVDSMTLMLSLKGMSREI